MSNELLNIVLMTNAKVWLIMIYVSPILSTRKNVWVKNQLRIIENNPFSVLFINTALEFFVDLLLTTNFYLFVICC